jgi:geranylgeranyl reductase family protein
VRRRRPAAAPSVVAVPAAATTTDVVVVGAGPAGAAAAITLARAGRDVVLVDKARFPRDKCCGDGLTTGALRRLRDLGLKETAVESWQPVDAVHVRSPSGREVTFPLPHRGDGTYGAVARRADLDRALLDVARDAGAKVHDGHALAGARRREEGDGVVVDVEGVGAVHARYAIGADGMWSPLRKLVSGALVPPSRQDRAQNADDRPYLGEWHAFRQYVAGVDASPDRAGGLWVWFDPDLLPGYAWSFPLPGGRANVGFGVPRRPGQPTHTMKDQWPDVLRRAHVREVLGPWATPEAPHKAWPIPADPAGLRTGTTLSAWGGRVLFAGDAARAADPLTGEGIGQALDTGVLAAEAVLAAGPARPDAARAAYHRAVATTLGTDNQFAAVLSRALALPLVARAAVRAAGATPWTRRNFGRWLFEDYPRAVLLTPSRWRSLRTS